MKAGYEDGTVPASQPPENSGRPRVRVKAGSAPLSQGKQIILGVGDPAKVKPAMRPSKETMDRFLRSLRDEE